MEKRTTRCNHHVQVKMLLWNESDVCNMDSLSLLAIFIFFYFLSFFLAIVLMPLGN